MCELSAWITRFSEDSNATAEFSLVRHFIFQSQPFLFWGIPTLDSRNNISGSSGRHRNRGSNKCRLKNTHEILFKNTWGRVLPACLASFIAL